MLAFIDQIVIPFLNSLYGAVGYLGVMIAMAIESAMIPLPSELILPYAGFLVSDPTQIEPLTGNPWSFWLVVIFACVRLSEPSSRTDTSAVVCVALKPGVALGTASV